jgi:hypothetical protein
MQINNFSAPLLFVLLATLVVNMVWQEQIAGVIYPAWTTSEPELSGKEVANPLAPIVTQLREQGIDLVIPAMTALFKTSPPTRFSLLSMLPSDSLVNKIDVLFVGDSTLMWGFDHRQVAHNSGLRTAQISFGQNIPDSDLAWFTRLLAKCVIAEDGIIVLSYGVKGLAGDRPNRPIDQEVQRSTEMHSCDDLADSMQGEVSVPASPITDLARYKAVVLDKLVLSTDGVTPFWSARIGWKNFFPDKREKQNRWYLVWQSGLKVPWQGSVDHWYFRQFDANKASADWKKKRTELSAEYSEAGRAKMQAWNGSQIGRPVCHVLPPTSSNEDFRFGLWRDWTSSRCLLDFGSIAKSQLGITELKIIDKHHYAEESGLVMAAAVGKLLKSEYLTIARSAAVIKTSTEASDRAEKQPPATPREIEAGVWIR